MNTILTRPTSSNERIDNLDIIRGVALLGILIMNVQVFSMIVAAYTNPTSFGDLTGSNFVVYYLSHIFADQKFMTLFSILFGAGIILMADNIDRKQGHAAKIHYKRMAILAIFGLLHAYLLWFGDILFGYALAGMLVYRARHKSITFLLAGALGLLMLTSIMMLIGAWTLPHWPPEALQEMESYWSPGAESIRQELIANTGSWLNQAEHRHSNALDGQLNLVLYLPRVGGLMMVGMALFKLDFFGLAYPSKTLMLGGLIAFAVSLGLIVIGNQQNFNDNWNLHAMFAGSQFNYWGSLLMAYTYLCFLVVYCRADYGQWMKRALACVGRMSLTNYLGQSLICGFIFFGWGLGLFGSVERSEQIMIVVAIWVFQLIFSSLWIRRFQFGPAEWLWRSMTYGKLQPMRK